MAQRINALVRVEALAAIKHLVLERGFEFPAFIHDRTVIEDTESSIDLVANGWRLLRNMGTTIKRRCCLTHMHLFSFSCLSPS
jgi:hypothetical protein